MFVLLVAVAAAAPWTVERLHLGVDLGSNLALFYLTLLPGSGQLLFECRNGGFGFCEFRLQLASSPF